MKKVFLAFIFGVAITSITLSCNRIESKDSASMSKEDSLAAIANAPIIEFDKDVIDFGTITEGDTVQHDFIFKNVGKSALQIKDVQVQCGCTVASKPEQPVGIGQSSKITVKFNSKGKVGINKKFITVYSNAEPAQNMLAFTAVVKAKE